MIQVQIASQVTARGVDGIRWVLVDVAEAPSTVAAPPPPSWMSASAPPAERTPVALSLTLLKLLVMGAGAGLAIWLAQAAFGPANLRWWTPPRPAVPTRSQSPADVSQPLPPRPAASAAAPMVTAQQS